MGRTLAANASAASLRALLDAFRAAARRGPPSLTPRRLAAAKAALVRSLIAARSCSATATRMWTVSKNTPADIVDKLNREINAGLADPKMQARLADLGGTVLALSPPDFGKLIADETEKWGKVVKFLGIKAD
jgi:hypothetical protein